MILTLMTVPKIKPSVRIHDRFCKKKNKKKSKAAVHRSVITIISLPITGEITNPFIWIARCTFICEPIIQRSPLSKFVPKKTNNL
jgi:hypothetical protein